MKNKWTTFKKIQSLFKSKNKKNQFKINKKVILIFKNIFSILLFIYKLMQKYFLFFYFNSKHSTDLNYYIGKSLCLIRTNSDNFNIN